MSEYQKDLSGETWWCNSHQRRATYLFKDQHVCDPDLGGIMIPCSSVKLVKKWKVIEASAGELQFVLQSLTDDGWEIRDIFCPGILIVASKVEGGL